MEWLKKRRLIFFRGQRGFSLIEILVAAAIVATITVGFLRAVETNSRATRQLDEQVTASNLATAYLEASKKYTYAEAYPDALNDITIPFQYTVEANIVYTAEASDGANITWGTEYVADVTTLQRITVTVSREGRYILSVCTYRSQRG